MIGSSKVILGNGCLNSNWCCAQYGWFGHGPSHNYPARMRRDKVIGFSVCLFVCLSVCQSVVTTKITRSRYLGLRATCKCNQSDEISERLAWVCFESFGTVHGYHKKHLFLAHRGRAHRPCPLHCTTHAHNWPGRDYQHYRSISVKKVTDARRARGMCSGEL